MLDRLGESAGRCSAWSRSRRVAYHAISKVMPPPPDSIAVASGTFNIATIKPVIQATVKRLWNTAVRQLMAYSSSATGKVTRTTPAVPSAAMPSLAQKLALKLAASEPERSMPINWPSPYSP